MAQITAYFPIAPSGAGKSTYLSTLVTTTQRPIIVFSYDMLRHEFYHPTDYNVAFKESCKDKTFTSRANQRFHELCQKAIETDSDLYIDNMNLTVKSRRFHLTEAKKKGFHTHAILMPADVELLISRQRTRGDKYIPPNIVRDMVARIELPIKGEFDVVATSNHNL